MMPGERLERGIQNVFVLGEDEGLILRANECFTDEVRNRSLNYCIAPDQRGIHKYFSDFSTKTDVAGIHWKHLGTEVLLMSTHNIYFCGELRKISILKKNSYH